jgi:hypothetical protein
MDRFAATKALMPKWTKGNDDAMLFLRQVANMARLADDIVDGDKGPVQHHMVHLMHMMLVELPQNKFFVEHHATLAPFIAQSLLFWTLSDEFKTSENWKKQAFGFVYREAADQILARVVMIIGGPDWARDVMREYFDTFHAASAETIGQWVTES